MPKVTVQVEGYKEVINSLNSLGDTAKRVLEESAKAGAEYLRPIIQSAIPSSNDGDSKHLKDAVKLKKARLRRRDIQSADVVIGGNKDVDYGFHFETGHKGKKKRVEGTKVIRTATDNHAERAANIVAEHLLDKLGL